MRFHAFPCVSVRFLCSCKQAVPRMRTHYSRVFSTEIYSIVRSHSSTIQTTHSHAFLCSFPAFFPAFPFSSTGCTHSRVEQHIGRSSCLERNTPSSCTFHSEHSSTFEHTRDHAFPCISVQFCAVPSGVHTLHPHCTHTAPTPHTVRAHRAACTEPLSLSLQYHRHCHCHCHCCCPPQCVHHCSLSSLSSLSRTCSSTSYFTALHTMNRIAATAAFTSDTVYFASCQPTEFSQRFSEECWQQHCDHVSTMIVALSMCEFGDHDSDTTTYTLCTMAWYAL